MYLTGSTEIGALAMRKFVSQICPLDEHVVDAFIGIFHHKTYKKGEDFVIEGEVSEHIAFLVDGLLRSYYISPKGDESNKHFFLNNAFIAPLTSLVMQMPSPVNIGCMEESVMMVAEYRHLERLYIEHPTLNMLGRKLVEWAWVGKERRETQLIMLNATERYHAFKEEFYRLEERISQYQVASYLGITPVQLSRIRAQMK